MDAELYQPFKLCFKVLKTVGMWQDGNQSWTYFFCGYLFHFVIIDWYIVCQFIFLVTIDNLLDFVDALGLTATYVAENFKCYNLFFKLKAILKLYEMLEALLELSADRRFANRDFIKAPVAVSYKVYKMFWFSALVTCFSGAFVPIFSHKLPYKVWFPFDTESGFNFWFSSYYLVVNSFFVSAIDMALDILPVIFISFAIGLINELSERLKQIGVFEVESSERTKSFQVEELVKCIEIHKKILKFVEEIRINFVIAIFAQGLTSSIILCACAFTMTTVSFKLISAGQN